jgi:hypothetical protein
MFPDPLCSNVSTKLAFSSLTEHAVLRELNYIEKGLEEFWYSSWCLFLEQMTSNQS